jgi:hypothetical protein
MRLALLFISVFIVASNVVEIVSEKNLTMACVSSGVVFTDFRTTNLDLNYVKGAGWIYPKTSSSADHCYLTLRIEYKPGSQITLDASVYASTLTVYVNSTKVQSYSQGDYNEQIITSHFSNPGSYQITFYYFYSTSALYAFSFRLVHTYNCESGCSYCPAEDSSCFCPSNSTYSESGCDCN